MPKAVKCRQRNILPGVVTITLPAWLAVLPPFQPPRGWGEDVVLGARNHQANRDGHLHSVSALEKKRAPVQGSPSSGAGMLACRQGAGSDASPAGL